MYKTYRLTFSVKYGIRAFYSIFVFVIMDKWFETSFSNKKNEQVPTQKPITRREMYFKTFVLGRFNLYLQGISRWRYIYSS